MMRKSTTWLSILLLLLAGILVFGTSKQRTNDDKYPDKFVIGVPFSPQAPFANWDDPYQEACEEMSLIMVDYFLKEEKLSPEIADQEIQKIVAWETENGFPQDVNLNQLGEIAEKYYGYQSTIESELTINRIKEILSSGSPIIVPAAGRDLGNPYFSGEGPWYHMLVLRGYTKKHFITNDPGTRRGEKYKYKFDVLLNSVHDWTGIKEDIRNGPSRMLIVRKRTD